MTETATGSRAMTDITMADYHAIADAGFDLHCLIHNLMERIPDGPPDPAWNELHEMMLLVGVVSGAARRYADRAALPREPVDYRPADPDEAYRKRVEYGVADCAPFESER